MLLPETTVDSLLDDDSSPWANEQGAYADRSKSRPVRWVSTVYAADWFCGDSFVMLQ